jgi:hypothetical protein
MICEGCEAEEAAFTMIPTGEGLPESIGPACFARRGLELAKIILPAEEIAHVLGPMFVTPHLAEALKGKSKMAKGEAPEPEPQPEPTPEPAPRPDEIPATGTDE